MTEKLIGVTLTVHPDSEGEAARVVETVSRIATGLAMDGFSCSITLTPFEAESEEVETE